MVSPAQQSTTSNQEQTFEFMLRELTQDPIIIRFEGALAQYATTQQTRVVPTHTRETISITINPPQNLSPGRHELIVVFSQERTMSGQVGVSAEIAPEIVYTKTYPGVYLEPIIRPINDTNPLTVNILLQNLGEQEAITTPRFMLGDARYVQEEITITGMTNQNLRYALPSPKGEYTLTTTFTQTQRTIVDEQRVRVGKPSYDVVSVLPGRLQDITPITVALNSDWNVPLEKTIRAKVRTNNQEHELEDTQTIIESGSSFVLFWEDATVGVHELVLFIDEQEIISSFTLQEQTRIEELSNTLYIIIALCALALLLWVQIRKKMR